MASLLPNGKQQYFDNAGLPLVGGKLFTYDANTNNPRPTYSDQAGMVPNTNPIILNARGEALAYWSGAYRVTLQDSLGNVIWTVDGIVESGLGGRTSTTGSLITPAGTTAQRDAVPVPGYFRYNRDTDNFEGYYSNSWKSFLKTINGVPVPDNGNISLPGTSLYLYVNYGGF